MLGLIAFGQGIAFYGFLLTIGWYFLPSKIGTFLDGQNAKFGLFISGAIALLCGFLLASIGYYGG